MNMNLTANHDLYTRSGLSDVYVSYVNNNKGGFVAVIDPTTDQIIKRISTGHNPAAMCLSPSGDKLYVADSLGKIVFVYNTDTLSFIGGVSVGNKPAAIFVEPSGKKAYVANYEDRSVTIFDAITLNFIATVAMDAEDSNQGMPFAFAGHENSPYVYVSCKRDHARDYVLVIDINDDRVFPLDPEEVNPEPEFDQTHNPLAVHPNGHTLVVLADVGVLDYVGPTNIAYKSISLLDNTVSGIYLDNQMLFCTMREERKFLKIFKDLAIDANGNITYDHFQEIPSYKGQDKIRTSLTQKYIGVTIQPTDHPTGGVQIIDVDHLSSKLVALNIVGDLAFASDSKAYVGELNAVRPIDLNTAAALPAIDIGGYDFTVKNIISGYSNHSS